MNVFPKLSEADAAPNVCGFPTEDGQPCDKSATWHVIWSLEGTSSLTCHYHLQDLQPKYVYFAKHIHAPTCSAPRPFYLRVENRCVTDEPENERVTAMEREAVLV